MKCIDWYFYCMILSEKGIVSSVETILWDLEMREKFITNARQGLSFVTTTTKSCQRIHLGYWQTVRLLIGACLEKIIQPSHPVFHLLSDKEQFCPSEK